MAAGRCKPRPGHTWHLQYGLLPWALLFYERALEPGRLKQAILAGVALSCMVLVGRDLSRYRTRRSSSWVTHVLLTIAKRSPRPRYALAIAGGVAIGLGAPKLFAILDRLGREPRLIESREVIGPQRLARDVHGARATLRHAPRAHASVQLARVGDLHRPLGGAGAVRRARVCARRARPIVE